MSTLLRVTRRTGRRSGLGSHSLVRFRPVADALVSENESRVRLAPNYSASRMSHDGARYVFRIGNRGALFNGEHWLGTRVIVYNRSSGGEILLYDLATRLNSTHLTNLKSGPNWRFGDFYAYQRFEQRNPYRNGRNCH